MASLRRSQKRRAQPRAMGASSRISPSAGCRKGSRWSSPGLEPRCAEAPRRTTGEAGHLWCVLPSFYELVADSVGLALLVVLE